LLLSSSKDEPAEGCNRESPHASRLAIAIAARSSSRTPSNPAPPSWARRHSRAAAANADMDIAIAGA